jgi:CDP-archaeol synthase
VVSTIDTLACAEFIITAFVLSGIAHVMWLRSRASLRFNFPLDGGHCLGGQRIFGSNKMFRGFIVMIPATGAAFAALFTITRFISPELAGVLWPLSPWQYAAIGVWAGFGFMAGELPNSFLKRRLAIPPGSAPPHPITRTVFFIIDRLDSIAGMLLALSTVVFVPFWTWIYVVGFGAAIHWGFSALLFLVGVKGRAA